MISCAPRSTRPADNGLLPLQAGIGTIANAVLHGFESSEFEQLSMYSEVLQDSAIELLDQGKLQFASASSITVSKPVYDKILANIEHYRERIVLRPQEISNAPEIVRRLGSSPSTRRWVRYLRQRQLHACGRRTMNGIGGSGDFARNTGDLRVQVHGQERRHFQRGAHGVARGPYRARRRRAGHRVRPGRPARPGAARTRPPIIRHCVHPSYREALQDYFDRACERGGQTPHLLEEAFSWHQRFSETDSMRLSKAEVRKVA